MLETEALRNCATAVSGDHIRMRLEKDISVRRLCPHSPEQLEIGAEPASAGFDGAIVLDLTRNEDVAPVARRPVNWRGSLLIFGETRLDDETAYRARPLENLSVEFTGFEEKLEFTRA